MSLSPEERADEIAENILQDYLPKEFNNFSDYIAAHIRDTRNEALEEAANIAKYHCDDDIIAEDIEKQIRSLMEKK